MKKLIIKYSRKYDLDPAIVYGVCMAESSMNPNAVRYERGYQWLHKLEGCAKETNIPVKLEWTQQKTSYGLMQVMGGVLREYGYKGRLSDILNDVESQLDYGCRHLAKKIAKYGLEFGILAYNSGSPRKNKNDQVIPAHEQFNADYLRKVMRYAAQFTNNE